MANNRSEIVEDLVIGPFNINDPANFEVKAGDIAVVLRDNQPDKQIYRAGHHNLGTPQQTLKAVAIQGGQKELYVKTTGGDRNLRYFCDIQYDVSFIIRFQISNFQQLARLASNLIAPKKALHDQAMKAVRYAEKLVEVQNMNSSLQRELTRCLDEGIRYYFRFNKDYFGFEVIDVSVEDVKIDQQSKQPLDEADRLIVKHVSTGVDIGMLGLLREDPNGIRILRSDVSALNQAYVSAIALGRHPQDLKELQNMLNSQSYNNNQLPIVNPNTPPLSGLNPFAPTATEGFAALTPPSTTINNIDALVNILQQRPYSMHFDFVVGSPSERKIIIANQNYEYNLIWHGGNEPIYLLVISEGNTVSTSEYAVSGLSASNLKKWLDDTIKQWHT